MKTMNDFQDFYTQETKKFIKYWQKDNQTGDTPTINEKQEQTIFKTALVSAVNYLLIEKKNNSQPNEEETKNYE